MNPGDEGRETHLDQRERVARVGVGDDPARTAAHSGGREELAPVRAFARRDDHHVAWAERVDGFQLAAVPVVRVGGHGVDCHAVDGACEPGQLRFGVERTDPWRHDAVADPDAVETVGDDGGIEPLEPVGEWIVPTGHVMSPARCFRIAPGGAGPAGITSPAHHGVVSPTRPTYRGRVKS